MSQNSPISIKYDFQPDALRLLPKEPFEVQFTLRYNADGVLDFEDLLGQLLAGIEEKMGKLQAISQEGRDDLKMQLAQIVIAQGVHTLSDVLEDFEDDGEPYWDAEGLLHLPLRMLGSGYKLDLVPRLDANGELDCEALVADLEEAYRGVFAEVII
ncbi:MAG: hypothetical protein KQI62_19025 [Deltaproteobacteria bacterium]|nr:hypothetical protein [Deltaproteobacteria bacterium]